MEACRNYLLLVANGELHTDLQAKVAPSDLVQDTFLEAQRDFGQFRGRTQAELLAWLRRILQHNLANCSRQYHQTEKRQVAREVGLHAAGDEQPAHDVAATILSPSTQAIAREQEVALAEALARLPEPYRDVIALRHRDGLEFAEIGARIGRSAEAARKLWARAVVQLKQELGPSP
jgi:RNA polymerase sigma-70 factor (ECF subfamily)